MAHDPDDKRPLFERVVADIRTQIMHGRLRPEDKVPPAREIAEAYGIATMTAQRALRELQAQGLIYGMPGKGSFVRPDAPDRLIAAPEPITTQAEHDAAFARWKTALDAASNAVDDAIAAEDWERVKNAKATVDKVFDDYQGTLLGMVIYTHRKAGVDIDAHLAQAQTQSDAETADRRTERDTPPRKSATPRKPTT